MYQNDIEVGRIVEAPAVTYEADLLALAQKEYVYAQYETCDWYEAEAAVVEKLKAFKGVEIIVFQAIWCPDCTYSVPILKKILQDLPFDVKDVPVNRDKKDAAGEAEKYALTSIPTVLVLQDGAELGRIVEAPKGTFEGDIFDILRGIDMAQEKKLK